MNGAPLPQDGASSAAESSSVGKILHDVRGLLAPAMLTADRLSLHADPGIREAAEQIIQSIEQAVHRLKDLRG